MSSKKNADKKAIVKKAEVKATVKIETPVKEIKSKGTKKELSKVQQQMLMLLKRPKGATISDMMKETGLEYRKCYMQILNWQKFSHPIKKVAKATFQYAAK